MFPKKSQTQGAAVLIFIMTLLVILYILALPPADRAELLGEQVTTVTGPGRVLPGDSAILPYTGKMTLLQETPGRVDYTALNEMEIPLNSFVLRKTINSKVLEQFNSFYIKNGVGDKTTKNLTFEIEDIDNTDNLVLSFKANKHQGVLIIKLNGETIYEFDINTMNPEPVRIKKSLLEIENTLEFSVSGVGYSFWKTNEYSFEDVKIIGDLTDKSMQDSQNSFFITEENGKNIETASLRFNPECNRNDAGKLTIKLNNRDVFSGVPDCGSPNFVEFAPSMILIGKNKIDFSTDAGSYMIDLIKLKLEFKENQIPVYYFDTDTTLFNIRYDDLEYECGKKDNVCPKTCDEDNDYDCCMTEYTTPFWCVADTMNSDDKCVGFVTTDNLNRCPTNYVGKNNDVSDAGEDRCGDNSDDYCPLGCTPEYDKDCCFDKEADQFWCDTMPTNGLGSRCVNSVSLGQCNICPTSYKGEGKAPICSPTKTAYEVNELKEGYGIILNMKFTEDYQRKEADIFINGHLTRLSTNGVLFQKDISELVEPGTNSIELVPFSILNIREIKVDVVE